MRLGIDAREIQEGVFTGIGGPLFNFIEYFSRQINEDRCILFSSKPLSYDFGERVTNVVCKETLTVMWDQVTLPRAVKKEHVDLFYSPYYKIPMNLSCKRVSALLDVMYSSCKDLRHTLSPFHHVYYATVGKMFAYAADTIITCSQYSKRDIVKLHKVREDKITVLPLSIGDNYRRETDETVIERVKAKWGIRTPYILYVSNFKPHKNVTALLKAFAILSEKDPGLSLVLGGPKTHCYAALCAEAETLNIRDRVIFTGKIEASDEPHVLYSGASVFVFPSLYEGFGIPPIEAMACGVPVVASNRTAIPEVVQDAGMLIDPYDSDSMADTIQRVLDDQYLYSQLQQKGFEYASLYRKDIVARKMYELFKEVATPHTLNRSHNDGVGKIAVIMLGGIGNLVLMVPMLHSLKKNFTQCKITLVVGEAGVADIVTGEGLVDEVVVFDEQTQRNIWKTTKFLLTLRKEHYRLSIVASNTHAFKGSLFSLLIGAVYRVGEDIKGKGFFYTHKVPFQYPTHEIDGAVEILKALSLTPTLRYPELNITEEETKNISSYLRDRGVKDDTVLVGIHAGSGEHQKYFRRWAKERFAQLADKIVQWGAAPPKVMIVLTGAQAERKLVNEIDEMMQVRAINAAGQFSIRETAALIKRCNLFIGNDSGLMHIAAAVKTPAVIIWGATNHAITSPRGENVAIVRKELPCSPCYDRGKVKCLDLHCLTTITVEDVMREVEGALGTYRYCEEPAWSS